MHFSKHTNVCSYFLHASIRKEKSLCSRPSIQFLIGDGIPCFRRKQKPSQTWQINFNIPPASGLIYFLIVAQVQEEKNLN